MKSQSVRETNDQDYVPTIRAYVVGFILALLLTLGAYLVTVNHWLEGPDLVAAIMGLALVQLIVQLTFFLHLGRSKRPQWKEATFYFMLIVLVIIVGGSLWIMNSLNYNMMSPEHMNEYMLEQSSKGF